MRGVTMITLVKILFIIAFVSIVFITIYKVSCTTKKEDIEEVIEPKESCEGCANWYCYNDGIHYCVLNNETQCFDNDFLLKEYKW